MVCLDVRLKYSSYIGSKLHSLVYLHLARIGQRERNISRHHLLAIVALSARLAAYEDGGTNVLLGVQWGRTTSIRKRAAGGNKGTYDDISEGMVSVIRYKGTQFNIQGNE